MTLVATGFAVGLQTLEGLEFNPQAAHCGCRLCGAVFQSDLDREVFVKCQAPNKTSLDGLYLNRLRAKADAWRQEWRRKHHATCPNKSASPPVGGFCTPEAALKLAPLGTFPLSDIHEEVAAAMLEAPRAPTDDVEGT